MSQPKKLSAERLTKIRRAIRQLTAWTTPEGGYESAAVDLLAHCDALADDVKVLREALHQLACFDDEGGNALLVSAGSYVRFDEPSSVRIARTALEKTA